MKCKICGGTGISNTCVNGTFKPCSFCDGTGEYGPFDADIELDKLDSEPQTNEEWLRQANTEQLAEWIVHLADDCTMQHECRLCNSWCDEKRVIEWLKQPHREVIDKWWERNEDKPC